MGGNQLTREYYGGLDMSVQIVSYTPNSDSFLLSNGTGLFNSVGATFTNNGTYVIDSAKCILNKVGSPTGNATMSLYAITGTPGSSALPTGPALATSGTLDVSTLTTTPTQHTFSFTSTNRVSMTNGTTYILTLDYNGGNGSNEVSVQCADIVSGQNSAAFVQGTGWLKDTTETLAFQIFGAYDTAPTTDFSANTTTLNAGDSVSFTDSSTLEPLSWSWDFGDGDTSTSQNPTHTYDTAGTYTVELVATNDGGSDTETKTNYITVVTPTTLTGVSSATGLSTITL